MGEWQQIKLGEFVSLQRGHDLPEKDRDLGDIPVMGSFGVTGRHSVARAKGPGVTIGRSGASIGVVCYVERDYWPLNTCLYVTDFHDNNPRFAYYFLRTLDLAMLNSGSAQPSLNRNFVHPIPIAVPGRVEQDEIAELLGALDDTIKLNERMSEKLEETVRTVFKDWFVDFGPTRAKAEGREPYLAAELWSLFPGALDDEDKPSSWPIRSIGELVEVVKGRSYKSSELEDSNTALVTLKSFKRGGGYRLDGLKPFTGSYRPEQVVAPGELIVALTDVTQAAEVVGKPAIVGGTQSYETLVASLDVAAVRPRDEAVGVPLLYCLLRTEEFQNHTYAHCSGTTVLHLSNDGIPSYEWRVPPRELLRAFGGFVQPTFDCIAAKEQESGVLAELRDLLLPKLMSGEIRLKDAERAVEAIA